MRAQLVASIFSELFARWCRCKEIDLANTILSHNDLHTLRYGEKYLQKYLVSGKRFSSGN
jgi:hypothetical protein